MSRAQIEQMVEHLNGVGGSPSNERDQSGTPVSPHNGVRLTGCVGSASSFKGLGLCFCKGADLGQTSPQAASGKSRRENGKAEEIVDRPIVESLADFSKHSDCCQAFAPLQLGARHVHIGRKLECVVADLTRDVQGSSPVVRASCIGP